VLFLNGGGEGIVGIIGEDVSMWVEEGSRESWKNGLNEAKGKKGGGL